jgi:hypothetical protein
METASTSTATEQALHNKARDVRRRTRVMAVVRRHNGRSRQDNDKGETWILCKAQGN